MERTEDRRRSRGTRNAGVLAGWPGCVLAAEWEAWTQPSQPARTVRSGDMVDTWPETWWTHLTGGLAYDRTGVTQVD
jgi:hypothetical protein